MSTPSKRSFTPHFSDAAREREKLASLREALAEQWLKAKAAEDKVQRLEEEKRQLLSNLLNVEFEARVAKGCYDNCPRGRLKSTDSGAA